MDGWRSPGTIGGDHQAITVYAKSEIPMRTGLTVIRPKLELMVITNYYRLGSYRGDYSQVLVVSC